MKLKINGINVTKPKTFVVNIIDVEDSDSTMQMSDGSINRDIIAVKRQIEVDFDTLSWANCSVILNLFQEDFTNINYPDPLLGTYTTKTFFVTRKTSPYLVKHKGELYWQGLSFTLIER